MTMFVPRGKAIAELRTFLEDTDLNGLAMLVSELLSDAVVVVHDTDGTQSDRFRLGKSVEPQEQGEATVTGKKRRTGTVEEVGEKKAVEDLVKFLQTEADLDDIAQMWSDRCGVTPVRIVAADDPDNKSDVYANGQLSCGNVELTKEQREAYLESKGARCPLCGSDDIEGYGPFEADGEIVWQQVTCNSCGAVWEDHHTLTNVELRHGPTATG